METTHLEMEAGREGPRGALRFLIVSALLLILRSHGYPLWPFTGALGLSVIAFVAICLPPALPALDPLSTRLHLARSFGLVLLLWTLTIGDLLSWSLPTLVKAVALLLGTGAVVESHIYRRGVPTIGGRCGPVSHLRWFLR
jgi:hypothetical protein